MFLVFIRLSNMLLAGNITYIGAKLLDTKESILTELYLIIPWNRGLPGKPSRPEQLKKFPVFYGTRRFIIAFTRARHMSLF